MTKISPEIASWAEEVSHAVFRVSALVSHPRVRFELEGAAVGLVASLDAESIDKLERLVRLGEIIGFIKPVNASVLLRELKNLESAILEPIASGEDIDLEEIFEKPEKPSFGGGNRQSAIMEHIRQLPNGCRMRDLVAQFPEVSERTLRYDLQNLVASGLVTRVGTQGPTSFFRAEPHGRSFGEKSVTKGEIIAL
ncbi:MAG: DeoR family transcriptional regulator [Candidatus Colwellbacteria bacterium]|nr:DeoR family transcriptional regulator [Candidatus Colwellbacteria bacterium]